MDSTNIVVLCERACSLVVTKTSVAFEVIGSIPHGSEYSVI